MSGEIEHKAVEVSQVKSGVELRAGHRVVLVVNGVTGNRRSAATEGWDEDVEEACSPSSVPPVLVEEEGSAAAWPSHAADEKKEAAAPTDEVQVKWRFQRSDGTKLGNEKFILTCSGGRTIEGTLQDGVLSVLVPPGEVFIEVDEHQVGERLAGERA